MQQHRLHVTPKRDSIFDDSDNIIVMMQALHQHGHHPEQPCTC